MADHGTVTLLADDTPLPVTGYAIVVGTSTGPTVPTTGQIWPRGSG